MSVGIRLYASSAVRGWFVIRLQLTPGLTTKGRSSQLRVPGIRLLSPTLMGTPTSRESRAQDFLCRGWLKRPVTWEYFGRHFGVSDLEPEAHFRLKWGILKRSFILQGNTQCIKDRVASRRILWTTKTTRSYLSPNRPGVRHTSLTNKRTTPPWSLIHYRLTDFMPPVPGTLGQ